MLVSPRLELLVEQELELVVVVVGWGIVLVDGLVNCDVLMLVKKLVKMQMVDLKVMWFQF